MMCSGETSLCTVAATYYRRNSFALGTGAQGE